MITRKRRTIAGEFEQIEREFFDIDETSGTARIRLRFDRPGDIFDTSCLSKTPIFCDDFDEWLRAAFEMISARYRIDLEICFDDPEGYTEEALQEIFRKNILLTTKSLFQSIRGRDRIAMGLAGAGLASFVLMMLIGRLWVTESFWHEVFFYALDIATTVFFWEAAGILLVENREHRTMMRGYRERFASIVFHCGKDTNDTDRRTIE